MATDQQALRDPRDLYPKPPFPEQPQPHPGSSAAMQPQPDYGEEHYRGSGRLAGRKAIVTGADSGIGRAVALAFAREGADVLVSYLSEDDDAAETVRLVEDAGRKGVRVRGDIQAESRLHGPRAARRRRARRRRHPREQRRIPERGRRDRGDHDRAVRSHAQDESLRAVLAFEGCARRHAARRKHHQHRVGASHQTRARRCSTTRRPKAGS